MTGRVIWICGRPGSGKTTLLRELRKLRPELACFDAEDVRARHYPHLGYSDEERIANICTLICLACGAVKSGRDAVVAAVTPTETLRGIARRAAQVQGVAFHLIHIEGRSRPLWEGSTYEEPVGPTEVPDDVANGNQYEQAQWVVDTLLPLEGV